MKTRLCALALGTASLFGVGSHEAQADYGCYSYYYSYTRCPSVVVYPVVYQAPVVYHYHCPNAPVLMVAPNTAPTLTVAPSAPVKIAPGTVLRVKGNFLGSEHGSVFVVIGSISMECQVQEWNPEYVQVQLPKIGVTANSSAQIVVADKDGDLKRRAHFVLVPTPATEVVPQGELVPRAPIELLGKL